MLRHLTPELKSEPFHFGVSGWSNKLCAIFSYEKRITFPLSHCTELEKLPQLTAAGCSSGARRVKWVWQTCHAEFIIGQTQQWQCHRAACAREKCIRPLLGEPQLHSQLLRGSDGKFISGHVHESVWCVNETWSQNKTDLYWLKLNFLFFIF